MKLKKISVLILINIFVLFCFGCKGNEKAADDVILTINKNSISLSEAKFYAYNKQAHYEVYYLASGHKLDWSAPYEDSNPDISMEDLVKKETLEYMKKQLILCEYAKEQKIILSDSDMKDIENEVSAFFEDGNEQLIKKSGVTKDVLIRIYTRQKYVKKLCVKQYGEEYTLDDENELYNSIIDKNAYNIELNDDLWNTISFKDAIVNEDEVEPLS